MKMFSLADRGFLPDPGGEYSKYHNPELVTCDCLKEMPSVILLGVPQVPQK